MLSTIRFSGKGTVVWSLPCRLFICCLVSRFEIVVVVSLVLLSLFLRAQRIAAGWLAVQKVSVPEFLRHEDDKVSEIK